MPILLLLGCGASMGVVHSSDLDGLDNDQLKQVQFYSGPKKIVFEAQIDEVVKQVRRETLIITSHQTGHRVTIPKETPGLLIRVDYISGELQIQFDPEIPLFFYQDLGSGLELVNTEMDIDGITYQRVLKSRRNSRGKISAKDRRSLTARKSDKTETKLERKKVSGVRTSQ